MRRSILLLVLVAGGVLALDLWTKQWATATLAYHKPVEVIGEFVRLTYTRNSGVAFGLGAGFRFPYYIFSIIAAVVILVMFLRRAVHSRTQELALALILGGALGNLVDRITTGEVVDFIEIGWSAWHWPVFNVADSAVTVGVVLFGITWTRASRATPEPNADDGTSDASGTEDAGSVGPGAERRGAAGSLPGGRTG